jgi:NADH dehydrogenase
VSLGQWFAAGEVYTIKIYGPIAWWMWRTIYLFKFHSFKKQVRIVINWTLNAFYPRDITKLL